MTTMSETTPLHVVVVAPETKGLPPLRWIRELGGLAEIEGVKLELIGGPTINQVQAARALRTKCDILIWSGHGHENGLVLANGQTVRGRWVATQVAAGKPRLMVLSSCGSQCKDDRQDSLTNLISKVGVNVIGFPTDLADEAAITYNMELVRALAAGSDVGMAHDVAIEAIEEQFPEMARGIQLMPGLTNGLRSLYDRMTRIEQEQRRQNALLMAIASKLDVDTDMVLAGANGYS